ncbi:MAG: ABC transporter permease [Litorilinea sp.]|nr:MAG: ABC transporter permease [Litorilinea sp.]
MTRAVAFKEWLPNRRMLRMTQSRREALAALAFLTPNLLAFLLVTLGPTVFSFTMGFTTWNGLGWPKWSGLRNYARLVEDPLFRKSVFNTAIYTLEFVPLAVICALGLALLFNYKAPGISLVRLFFFLPFVTDMISISFVWMFIYHVRFGILNYLFGLFSIPAQAWLGDTRWAMLAIVILSVWRWMGYYALIILAGLQGVPQELYDAARIDGANRWQSFYRITVPLISPALFFVVTTGIIASFQVFEQMYIMTRGGPQDSTISIAMFLYQQGFLFLRMGYASAVAWVLFFIIFIVTMVNWEARKRWVYEG